jgi:hypothetical protein
MQPRPLVLAVSATALLVCASLATADDSPFGKDLKATIALQGQTCDKVVDAKRNGDSDYVATCHDGNRYRVYVDASGRVVVQKL